MNSRDRRVLRRAKKFYEFFQKHQDEGFTLAEVCAAVGCSPGKTSGRAIKQVRTWALRDGWFFPPATPAGGFRYYLSKDASILIDPALHMGRIEVGVAHTKSGLLDDIRSQRSTMAPELRAIASAMLAAQDFEEKQQANLREFKEQVTADLVAQRREARAVS